MKLELDRIERKSYKLTSCIIVHRQLLRKVAAGLKVSHDFPHILQSSLFIVPLLFTLTGSPSSPPMRAAGRRQLIQLFHRRLPCQVPSSWPPYLTLFPFPKFMFSKQGHSLFQHATSCPFSYCSYMELLCNIT